MLSKKSGLDAEATVAALKSAVAAENLRVVTHINGQANAKLIGREVPADQILEIFRPDYAIRVWEAHKPAGIDIPLRIYVYEDQTGDVVVQCRLPEEVFAPYASPALMAVAAELQPIFLRIFNAVPGV